MNLFGFQESVGHLLGLFTGNIQFSWGSTTANGQKHVFGCILLTSGGADPEMIPVRMDPFRLALFDHMNVLFCEHTVPELQQFPFTCLQHLHPAVQG